MNKPSTVTHKQFLEARRRARAAEAQAGQNRSQRKTYGDKSVYLITFNAVIKEYSEKNERHAAETKALYGWPYGWPY